jgi:hypothetical protein
MTEAVTLDQRATPRTCRLVVAAAVVAAVDQDVAGGRVGLQCRPTTLVVKG